MQGDPVPCERCGGNGNYLPAVEVGVFGWRVKMRGSFPWMYFISKITHGAYSWKIFSHFYPPTKHTLKGKWKLLNISIKNIRSTIHVFRNTDLTWITVVKGG